MNKGKQEKLKGDKLRELILLVYFNNKYDKSKNKISWLKENLGYSTGGLYSALDYSGYFERKGDEINLTEKGSSYLKREILPHYTVFNPIGNFFIMIGLFLLFQWYLWTYSKTLLIFQWYSALLIIAGGIVVRFFFMRLTYQIMKRQKQTR